MSITWYSTLKEATSKSRKNRKAAVCCQLGRAWFGKGFFGVVSYY